MDVTTFRYSGMLAAQAVTRGQILALEAAMLMLEQRDCPVEHEFTPGQYLRRMRVPPWTAIVGAEHTTEHLVRLEQGAIEVLTEEGLVFMRAPCEFVSKPGLKRVGRTFEDGAVWSTIHENPDDCRDLDVIVPRISTSQNSDLLGNRPTIAEVKKCLLE